MPYGTVRVVSRTFRLINVPMAWISSGRARRKNRPWLRQYNSKAAFYKMDGRAKEKTAEGVFVPLNVLTINYLFHP
jgi:hypothetical protein